MRRYRCLATWCVLVAFGGCSTSNGTEGGEDRNVGGNMGVIAGGSTSGFDVSEAGANAAGTGSKGGAAGTPSTSLCEPQTSQGMTVPPILEFQVDISGSMTDVASSAAGNQTKWNATRAAMTNAFGALSQSHPDWAVGITFFNRPGTCYAGTQETTVPIAPLDAVQNEAISAAIAAQRPQGYTPTFCAWQYAFEQVVGYLPPAGSSVYERSKRYIVLMTDGIPTVRRDCCTLGGGVRGSASAVSVDEFDYFVDTIATTGQAAGVQTFVIGVPGSEQPQGADYDPRYMLSRIADVGGTSIHGCTSTSGTVNGIGNQNSSYVDPPGSYCHVDLTTAADLATALENAIAERITGTIASCQFTVPPPSSDYYVDLAHTKVAYSPTPNSASQLLQAAADSSCAGGDFYLDDPQNATQLILCPVTCSAIQANPEGQLTVTFDCLPWLGPLT